MTGADRRSVLLITLDQWRADCLGAFGHPVVRTPHLDALARDGVAFRRHYTQAAPCGPARASLFTGLYLHNHRSLRNGTPLDARHRTLAQEVRRAGLEPVLFGYTDTSADPRRCEPGDPALETYEGLLPGMTSGVLLQETNGPWLAYLQSLSYPIPEEPRDIWLPVEGFEIPPGRGPSYAPARYDADHSETVFLTDAALDHLAVTGSRDQLVHLSYLRPHPPWTAPEPWNALYDPAAVPAAHRRASWQEEGRQHPWLAAHLARLYAGPAFLQSKPLLAGFDEIAHRELRATYYALITQVDEQIGRVVARLKQSGAYDRTLIVVTADHGEQLGDHWLYGKDGYFDAAFNIPLIVRDPRPGAARGRVVERFTETVDVMPTILEWLGQDVPPQVDGRSLLPFLHGEAPADWRREAHWEYDFGSVRDPSLEQALGLRLDQCGLAVLRGERSKYVHFAGLPPLLFDLARDPQEMENRAGDPDYAGVMLEQAQRMLSWRMTSEDRTLTHMHLGPGGVAERRS